MGKWQKEKLSAFQFVDNDRTMFQKIAEWAKELGFEFCAFAMYVPRPASTPLTFVATNFPEAWQKTYADNNFVDIDPAALHGQRSEEMIVWSDALFAGTPDFWKAAQEAGLRHGLTIPTRGSQASIGWLSLARTSDEITQDELAGIELNLAGLGQIAHQGMTKHLKISSDVGSGLSKREIAVLYWTAEGKTSGAIADILNISERTVNFHINNAIKKLDAPNKTAATVKAALLGLF